MQIKKKEQETEKSELLLMCKEDCRTIEKQIKLELEKEQEKIKRENEYKERERQREK